MKNFCRTLVLCGVLVMVGGSGQGRGRQKAVVAMSPMEKYVIQHDNLGPFIALIKGYLLVVPGGFYYPKDKAGKINTEKITLLNQTVAQQGPPTLTDKEKTVLQALNQAETYQDFHFWYQDQPAKDNGDLLSKAAYHGAEQIVKFLLDNGLTPNIQSPEYWFTPLHFASVANKEDCVKILLNRGANPNITDRVGNTPTIIAARYGKGEKAGDIIKKIRKYYSKLDLRNYRLNTALHEAVLAKNPSAIHSLLIAGHSTKLEDANKKTPIELLIKNASNHVKGFKKRVKTKLKEKKEAEYSTWGWWVESKKEKKLLKDAVENAVFEEMQQEMSIYRQMLYAFLGKITGGNQQFARDKFRPLRKGIKKLFEKTPIQPKKKILKKILEKETYPERLFRIYVMSVTEPAIYQEATPFRPESPIR